MTITFYILAIYRPWSVLVWKIGVAAMILTTAEMQKILDIDGKLVITSADRVGFR